MVLTLSLCGIPISINECIGDSLHTINAAFTALDFRTSAITPPTTAGNIFLTTISGGNIVIGGLGTTTIISGDTLVTENLFLSGDAFFYGDLTVDGTITGSLLSSTGDLVVDGDAYIYGKLTAAELSSTGDLTVDGDTYLKGNLDVLGDAHIHGKLTASELSSTGNLTVDGDTTLKGNLSVYGNSFLGDQCSDFTQIQGTLKLPCVNSQNAIEFNNEGTITGIPLTDGLVIRYETNLFAANEDALLIEKTDSNQFTPAGGIAIRNRGNAGTTTDQSFAIRGDGNVGLGTWYPNKTLTVIGEVSATRNVQFNLDLQVDGNTILGDGGKNTTIKDDLFVKGATTMDGDLTVLGDMTVLGNTTQLDTYVNITSSVDINCSGAVTALVVNQTGNTPVAHFKDDGNSALYIEGNTSGAVGGFVGIGTPNPTERLQVQGNIALSPNNGNSRGIFVPTLPANSTDLKIDTTNNIILQEINGNVAIGRSIPATTLDVNGDVTITDKIIHSADTNTCIRFPVDDNFAIETNGTDRVRVIANGYVGINQTVPTERLHVVGNVLFEGVQEIVSNSSDPALKITQSGSGYALRVDDVTGDTDPFVIDDNGNVGIKTSSCVSTLDVRGGVRAQEGVPNSNDSSDRGFSFGIDGDTGVFSRVVTPGAVNGVVSIFNNNIERMTILPTGFVGINQTTPTKALDVIGEATISDNITMNSTVSIENRRLINIRPVTRTEILNPPGNTYDTDPVSVESLRNFIFDTGGGLTISGNITIDEDDHDRTYVCTNSSPITITCPSGKKVGLQVSFIRAGTGTVTFVNSGGTTVNSALGFKSLAFTNSAGTVYLGQANTYYLFGDLLP